MKMVRDLGWKECPKCNGTGRDSTGLVAPGEPNFCGRCGGSGRADFPVRRPGPDPVEGPEPLEAARSPIETLRADASFLRHYLQYSVVSVAVRDNMGNVVNTFAAVQIPDWAVRQRLDDIDAAIAAEAGRAVSPGQPELHDSISQPPPAS